MNGRSGQIVSDIQSEWSRLRDMWKETRSIWRDDVGSRFEKEHWKKWEDALPQYVSSLENLLDTLDKAIQRTDF